MLLAQDFNAIQTKGLPNFIGGKNIGEVIQNSNILTYIFGLAGILLLVYLVTAGLSMMTSRGEPKAMQMAQGKIMNALLGFVIIIIAYFLVGLVAKIFGINSIITIFSK